MTAAVKEPQPPPVANGASSPEIQNSDVVGYAASVITVYTLVTFRVVVVVAADAFLNVESSPVGFHGLFGKGGTEGALGGAKAAAKASTLEFFVRMAT